MLITCKINCKEIEIFDLMLNFPLFILRETILNTRNHLLIKKYKMKTKIIFEYFALENKNMSEDNKLNLNETVHACKWLSK